MDQTPWNTFQYRKAHGYQVYLRFKSSDLQSKFQHLITELGFQSLTETESKKISLRNVRILTVQAASARLQMAINGPNSLDKYGQESLALQGGLPVYTFRRVGMMSLPMERPDWELAINHEMSQTDQLVGLRVLLVRYLAQALAAQGVLAYWGAYRDENIELMKQAQSYGEAVLIDTTKRMVYHNGGEARFSPGMKIIRKDKEGRGGINREELISYLSVSTCLLSFSGITPLMKRSIYDLSATVTASYANSDIHPSL